MTLLYPTKRAASRSYDMAGRLYLSGSGYLLLTVPNAIVRGVFDTLDEQGIELPPSSDGQLKAHITVMRPEEVKDTVGDPDKISERGHTFRYSLGKLKSFSPSGWLEMSKVWVIEVKSPELEKLRKSYGMTKLPNDNKFAFHISVAVRRKSVLGPNSVSKAAELLRLTLPCRAGCG